MRPLRPHSLVLVAAVAAGASLLAASPARTDGGAAPLDGTAAPGFPPGMMGSLLVAEVAALRGGEADADRAIRRYLDAARLHEDPALAERAARIATGAKRPGLAADAAAVWRRLDPEDRDAWRMHALMLARARRGSRKRPRRCGTSRATGTARARAGTTSSSRCCAWTGIPIGGSGSWKRSRMPGRNRASRSSGCSPGPMRSSGR